MKGVERDGTGQRDIGRGREGRDGTKIGTGRSGEGRDTGQGGEGRDKTKRDRTVWGGSSSRFEIGGSSPFHQVPLRSF